MQKVNFLIVHFNTQLLTECLLRSIQKYNPNCHIYIFDNSTKTPFVNTLEMDNITVFDNTLGQIINFDKWLEGFPNRNMSGGKINKWASAKHCYTIDKCMDLINDNFILLDSDILLKRNVSSLWDESVIYSGEVFRQINGRKRILPFINFINVKMCKRLGIRYFDEKYMHGLCVTPEGDRYDTGGGFFVNTANYPSKSIKVDEYIVHYKGGSWEKRPISQELWLRENKEYWSNENDNGLTVIVSATNSIEVENLKKNIRSATNRNIEWLIYDNVSNTSTPIVYDNMAKIAKHEKLLFIQQDVHFKGGNLDVILNKLTEPNCGMIGFAGSKVKVNAPSEWETSDKYDVYNFYLGDEHKYRKNNVSDIFETVVTECEYAFFISKTAYLLNGLDTSQINIHNGYGLDLSLKLHVNGYKNYVCTLRNLTIIKECVPNKDAYWCNIYANLTYKKWGKFLPVTCDGIHLSKNEEIDTIKDLNTKFIAILDEVKEYNVRTKIGELNNVTNKCNKKVNLLIVHFNTQKLTDALLKSIQKYTPDCHIYIFDNSNKTPFVNTFDLDNITYFDNTKGQIIDFDKWLEKYPNRFKSSEATHTFGSAKHCYTIDKCMDLINDNFILLDSDILLKKDISSLFDDKYYYVGDIEKQNCVDVYRILPFICFINVKKCKKEGIRYFDENYMHGLYASKEGDWYDTGAAFNKHVSSYPHKNINHNEYIVHYKGGSWGGTEKERKTKGFISQDEWLNFYKRYWCNENNKVIYTCITGNYDTLIEPSYVSKGFDYICFTDNTSMTSKIWEIRPLPSWVSNLCVTNVKKQRCIKINPHKILSEYDLSIWVDGSIELRGDLNKFLEQYCSGDSNIYLPQHPIRDCIYDEAAVCKRMNKDNAETMAKQISEYKKEGFPKHFGLVQSNIVVRKHNDANCVKLMDLWWDELQHKSHRDQLSFNYAVWKTKVGYKELYKRIYLSEYFNWNTTHKAYVPNTTNLNSIKNSNSHNNNNNNNNNVVKVERVNRNGKIKFITTVGRATTQKPTQIDEIKGLMVDTDKYQYINLDSLGLLKSRPRVKATNDSIAVVNSIKKTRPIFIPNNISEQEQITEVNVTEKTINELKEFININSVNIVNGKPIVQNNNTETIINEDAIVIHATNKTNNDNNEVIVKQNRNKRPIVAVRAVNSSDKKVIATGRVKALGNNNTIKHNIRRNVR